MTNLDAERSTLGAILSAGIRRIDHLHLRPEDFYLPAHELVYDAILRVIQAGNRPDPITVRMAIGPTATEFRGQDVGLFLHGLVESLPLAAQLDVYAAEVAAEADRRGWQNVATTVAQWVEEGIEPGVIEDRTRKMLDRAPRRSNSVSRDWDDINPAVIDHIEKGARKGLTTPWPDLNRHLTGLVGSRLYTIAARPGQGKSLVGQAISTHIALKLHKPVLFASLEMSELDLGVRIYADQASVPMNVLLSGSAGPSHWDAISQTSERLRSMGLRVNDNPSQTVQDIHREARGIRGLGAIVVDYLQLVKPSDPKATREQQVAQMSRDLKLMAKALDVPVISLAQMNRNQDGRADKTPVLSDLRESGAIEQDSDVVILMALDPDTSELTAYVAKNRHGSKGAVNLQLWGHLSRVIQGDGKSA